MFFADGAVAGEGPAVGVEVVGLVQFPDLVSEGVLDRVTALFTEAMGPHVAAFGVDEVRAGVAESVQDLFEL